MFDAQLLIATGTDYSILGPWMPRGGDNIIFGIDVVKHTMSAGQFDVSIETKAVEAAGDGDPVGSALEYAYTDTGTETQEVNALVKDLVRYKFAFNGVTTSGQWVLFRMLPPIWSDAV